MDFGEQIKAIRQSKGLTQEKMADRLGVSRQAVSNWENNRNLPDIEMLMTMSDAFGLTLDQLIRGGDGMNNMAEKLIRDGSETRRARLNALCIGAGTVQLLLGLSCIALKATTVEYVDAAGVLHENFFLLPLGFLLLFAGFVTFFSLGTASAVSLLKNGSSAEEGSVLGVSVGFIVTAFGIALFALLALANS